MIRDKNIVNVWVTTDARFIVIPAKYFDVKINKNGKPDKRHKRYSEFMQWINEIENDKR